MLFAQKVLAPGPRPKHSEIAIPPRVEAPAEPGVSFNESEEKGKPLERLISNLI
jgi:hypothetical protein